MRYFKRTSLEKQKIRMVITDLDGTLFNEMQEVEEYDLQTLHQLKEMNIIRAIATGRNLFSVQKRLKPEFPVDYVIFSSGAGIYDWNKQELIHSDYLPKNKVKHITYFLIQHQVDFMIHEMVPHNHKFVYYKSPVENPDFNRRFELYKEFAEPLDIKKETFRHASQILAIPKDKPDFHLFTQDQIEGVKIIRTTSPLDGESLWIEIFPEGVSKGHGTEWLCKHTHTDPKKTLGIGNDYNDLDLLDFTGKSFVVENAPQEIKAQYQSCQSNVNCGFSDAVQQVLQD